MATHMIPPARPVARRYRMASCCRPRTRATRVPPTSTVAISHPAVAAPGRSREEPTAPRRTTTAVKALTVTTMRDGDLLAATPDANVHLTPSLTGHVSSAPPAWRRDL